VTIRRLSTDTVLIGLRRVGLVGLREALRKLDEEPRLEEDAAVERLLEVLRRRNYIPEEHEEAYRRALGRELRRSRGGDLRPLFEEIAVTIRGAEGADRSRLLEDLGAILAELELRPALSFEPAGPGENPQVVIGGEVIHRGPGPRPRLRTAVERTLSDW